MSTTRAARRFITYKASPPPPSNRQRLQRTFLAASLGSAGAVSLYYAAFPPVRSADSGGRNYSSTIKVTDTATHPRNYKMTVSDPISTSTLLRTNEKSTYLKKDDHSSGILSYHFNQVASNSPIEDDHVESIVSHDGFDWSFFGVFDGHGGWTTSDKLKRELVPCVVESLQSEGTQLQDVKSTNLAIQRGFVNLDREIVYQSAERVLKAKNLSKADAVAQLMPAMSGSCGLLACFDARQRQLHVAVTGDSRAIYAQEMPDRPNTWSVTQLSEDQTGSTASEVSRLRAEHPGEENVVRNGRILGGLEPSRAFGDARYKWSATVQAKISELFYGRRPPAALLSPPYVTARPEVTTRPIDPARSGFMVLGTDGLYEMLTNEEITRLVVDWRAKYGPESQRQVKSSWIPAFLGGGGSNPPVEVVVDDDDDDDDGIRTGQKTPHASSKDDDNKDKGKEARKRFVCEDANVATHIIRNALGGGDTDRLTGLLSLPYPLSRSYRDDISVTVVFFGEDGDRREAHSLAEAPAAKL